jgi:CheY-like chemotaxis protein
MSEAAEVLIVEDQEENILFVTEILEEHSYRYRVARNGREAMVALRESVPDLVLLDIMMPRKSGINVFKEMRREPALEDVPVIFVTGATAVTGVDLATGEELPKEEIGDEMTRRFGATLHEKFAGLDPDGLIEKPIDPPVLIAKIEEVLA